MCELKQKTLRFAQIEVRLFSLIGSREGKSRRRCLSNQSKRKRTAGIFSLRLIIMAKIIRILVAHGMSHEIPDKSKAAQRI